MRGQLVRGFSVHADAVVLHLEQQAAVGENAAAQGHGAAADAWLEAMLDRVLDQRLQQHAGDDDGQRLFGDLLDDAQFFAEADDLDVEVVVGEGELVGERDERLAVLQQHAQDVGQLDDHLARQFRLRTHERGDGVERVEEEVRIDLALQRVQARLHQQAALLFQLALDADRVPDLQRNADDDRRAGADGEFDQPDWASAARRSDAGKRATACWCRTASP